MKTIRRRALAVILGSAVASGLLALGPSLEHAAAQSASQPLDLPCAAGVSVAPLGQALPSGADGQALAALRVEFAPDGRLGSHTHPGTLIVSVESGAFGFTMTESATETGSHDAMQIMRAGTGASPAASEGVEAGTEYVLHPGDWIVEPPGMVHSARSAADEPTVVLVTGLVDQAQPLIQCLDDATGS